MMFKNETFQPVKAVLISEEEGNVSEIDLDISSEKREIFKLLKGPATFIGQCYETNIVAMKCRESIFELCRTITEKWVECIWVCGLQTSSYFNRYYGTSY